MAHDLGTRSHLLKMYISFWNEWIRSNIAPSIIHYNLKSLENDNPHEYLLYGLPRNTRRNDGRLRGSWLRRYRHLENGGWWCAGENVLSGKQAEWGCFKPLTPRTDGEGKVIKYEHPPQVPTELFALHLGQDLENAIYDRAAISVERTAPTFWQHLRVDPRIPLVITEGAKKAGCLLSHGYAGLGLPGVHNGARRVGANHFELIPHLAAFELQNRDVYLAFDQDKKHTTIHHVSFALKRLGDLLQSAGANVYLCFWDNAYKGVDDLVAGANETALHQAIASAIPFDAHTLWEKRALESWITDRLSQRYIDLEVAPDTQLLGLKSPKGTGKTELLSRLIAPLIQRGERTLVLGHRRQLMSGVAERLGIDYIRDVGSSPTKGIFGYAMCVDSLHHKCSARFEAEEWQGATLIFDEADQVLHHLLNSSTCEKYRPLILTNLRKLLRVVIGSGGRVILADADLSSTCLRYFSDLIGTKVRTQVFENTITLASVPCTHHETPEALFPVLLDTIGRGENAIVHCSAQKSSSLWGTQNLERRILALYPDCAVLRIDAETIADPHHAAYGCLRDVNSAVSTYQVVLASPALETGASIDGNHFQQVFGIFSGVQAMNSVPQALARVRLPVPRHIFVAKQGLELVAGGHTRIKEIRRTTDKHAQTILKMLALLDLEEMSEEDALCHQIHVNTWATLAAQHNLERRHYRALILEKLTREGYVFTPPPDPDKNEEKTMRDDMKVSREELMETDRTDTLEAPTLPPREYDALKEKRSHTPSERAILRRGGAERRYQIPLTEELLKRDEKGFYAQIRLHYFLTLGRQQVSIHDMKTVVGMLDDNDGRLYDPDVIRRTFGTKVLALEVMNVAQFLNLDKTWTRESLEEWYDTCVQPYRDHLEHILGMSLSPGNSLVGLLNRILKRIGCSLVTIRQQGSARKKEKRLREYGFSPPADERWEIFEAWQQKANNVERKCA